MSPEEDSELDALDEQIVAYLDGELEPVERASIERRLAIDDSFRERVQSLERAWDALDLLPRLSASEAFTSTTVSMVAAEEERMITGVQEQVKSATKQRWMALLITTLVAAAIGFALVYRQLTDKDRLLVRDLPVIEHVDELTNTPSVEFLKQLESEGMFLSGPDDK